MVNLLKRFLTYVDWGRTSFSLRYDVDGGGVYLVLLDGSGVELHNIFASPECNHTEVCARLLWQYFYI